jgi:hypothetical protein
MAEDGNEQERWDTHFRVEYSHTAYNDAIRHQRYFTTKPDALDYADGLKNGFQCVWLLERGYREDAGRMREWFYFWWSHSVTEMRGWEILPNPGWGRPINSRSSVRYKPGGEPIDLTRFL